MALAMEHAVTLTLKNTLNNRFCFLCLKHITRSCHVAVKESLPALFICHSPSQLPTSDAAIRRSSLRKILLSCHVAMLSSDRLQLASRSYSVLPQRAIYTTPLCLHDDHNHSEESTRTCWNCNRPTNPLLELFFCECGVVQSLADDVTYFTLFNIKQSFDVDIKQLGEVYKDLQKRLHPDMFSNKSETERHLAEQQSALLNKAYSTLLKPLPRALYLLGLHGYCIDEGTTEMNQEFLMEVLDLNEIIGESNLEDIHIIEKKVIDKINQYTKDISASFSVGDFVKAKDLAIRLQYYDNVESKLKAFYRDRM